MLEDDDFRVIDLAQSVAGCLPPRQLISIAVGMMQAMSIELCMNVISEAYDRKELFKLNELLVKELKS